MGSGYFYSVIIENKLYINSLQFSVIGVDGTTYADLHVIGKSSGTQIVHGQENKVIYTDIEFIKR